MLLPTTGQNTLRGGTITRDKNQSHRHFIRTSTTILTSTPTMLKCLEKNSSLSSNSSQQQQTFNINNQQVHKASRTNHQSKYQACTTTKHKQLHLNHMHIYDKAHKTQDLQDRITLAISGNSACTSHPTLDCS